MQPDAAERLDEDGTSTEIPTADVTEGMRLLVRPGSRIPVDGTVIEGVSEVDESIVTGEPLPVAKNIGDELIAGSMNTSGQLVLETTVMVDTRPFLGSHNLSPMHNRAKLECSDLRTKLRAYLFRSCL